MTNKPESIIKVLFVDGKDGSDSNSGAEDSPFKTIQHAIDSIAYGRYGIINVFTKSEYNENLTITNKFIKLQKADSNAFVITDYTGHDHSVTIGWVDWEQNIEERNFIITIQDRGCLILSSTLLIRTGHGGIHVTNDSCFITDCSDLTVRFYKDTPNQFTEIIKASLNSKISITADLHITRYNASGVGKPIVARSGSYVYVKSFEIVDCNDWIECSGSTVMYDRIVSDVLYDLNDKIFRKGGGLVLSGTGTGRNS